jgi:hypothetical protein
MALLIYLKRKEVMLVKLALKVLDRQGQVTSMSHARFKIQYENSQKFLHISDGRRSSRSVHDVMERQRSCHFHHLRLIMLLESLNDSY